MMKVLMVGCDLTSQGGIASVVKCLYSEAERTGTVDYTLVKTTDYKHGTRLTNLLVFAGCLLRILVAMPSTDIVHLQTSSHVSFYRKNLVFFLARLWRKPVIWHLHASRFAEFFIMAQGTRRRMIDVAFRSSDLVLVLCDLFRTQLAESYGLKNVQVLRNPIASATTRRSASEAVVSREPAPAGEPVKVLFVGFYIRSKGVLDLLEVAIRCAAHPENRFRFLLGGQGPLEKDITDCHARFPETVVNLGWLDEASKRRAYQAADVFILPSYNEGMPIVILEAMEAGLPVVSTRIAGIPEQILDGENGFLVEPGNVEDMVAALQKLADAALRTGMGSRSRELVATFRVDSVFADLLEIYRQVSPASTLNSQGRAGVSRHE